MNFFASKYQSQITDLQEQVQERDLTIAQLNTEIAGNRQTISAFPQVKQEYDAQISKVTSKFETLIGTMELKHKGEIAGMQSTIEQTKKSVQSKINLELASLGVPIEQSPREEINLGSAQTYNEVMETFTSLRGTEQTEYYKTHQAKIMQALAVSSTKQFR